MALLTSIVGIGGKTARLLLAEMPPVERFSSACQMAAYAGVTPQRHESGTSVKRPSRASKVGSSRLRAGLYMPAVVARGHNPVTMELARRLEERGKHSMQIIVAIERKLLHIVYGVLKYQKPFDPEHTKAA